MPRVTPIINTFSSGELSPFLDGRTDVAAYYTGAKTVENFFILPYGGLMRRPGTYYVTQVKDSDNATRLIPFQFSSTQSYIIEMGNEYMRFYKDQGQITSGGSAYEISTPYQTAELFDIQFVQDADVMYLVHPNHKPRKLTRTGHTAWTLTNYAPTNDPFTAADAYPSCVCIFESRLCFANTNDEPQTVWMSVSQDYEDMTLGPNDDNALSYTLGSQQMNAIRWMSPGKILLLGTAGAIFSISSGSDLDPISPTNVHANRESGFGAINIIPQKIGNLVTYVDNSGKILREIGYSLEIDEYAANEITILSEHITSDDGIVDMDYQRSPYNMLWCIRGDGQAATMTRQIEQKLRGWTRQQTGYRNSLEAGLFESVAVIPGDDEDDEVWFVVRRYINEGWVRYIEYLKPTIFSDQEDAYFVDCGLSLNSPIEIENIEWSDDIVDEGNVITMTETIPAQTLDYETSLA